MTEKNHNQNNKSFFAEFWLFLRTNKKFWLIPVIVLILLLVVFILLTESSAVAPFIYDII